MNADSASFNSYQLSGVSRLLRDFDVTIYAFLAYTTFREIVTKVPLNR